MKLWKPHYYDNFTCIASDCPDSCCKEWSVTVDEDAASRYRQLSGPLGDRLRQVLTEEDGETIMAIENGRCPMWRDDGLCRIQAELGHEGLCQVCRDFPRLRHDYGDFVELGLELSCPEAARLILTSPTHPGIELSLPGGSEGDYDEEAMDVLKRSRHQVLAILENTACTVSEALTLALLYGYHVQGELDGGEALPFDPQAALEEAKELAKPADPKELLDFFGDLEILTPRWQQMLQDAQPGAWTEDYRKIARYFVERYWLQAVSDYDLYCRIKFIIVSCLVIRLVGGETVTTAQQYSKEIENDVDNVAAILDAAYAHPAFTDEKILGLLIEP